MTLQDTLSKHIKDAVKSTFNVELDAFEFQATRKDFAGDLTLVIFPLLKIIKGNPVVIGEQIGQYLLDKVEDVKGFNVVKGFLNIEIGDSYYVNRFNTIKEDHNFGFGTSKPGEKSIMVEYRTRPK